MSKGKCMAINESVDIGLNELIVERKRFEFELEVVLAEIEEYRELSERLPTHKQKILEFSEDSRMHSISIYAKLNVLGKTIAMLQESKVS